MKRNGVLTANDHNNGKDVINNKNEPNVNETLIYPCTHKNICENICENKRRCFAKYKKNYTKCRNKLPAEGQKKKN